MFNNNSSYDICIGSHEPLRSAILQQRLPSEAFRVAIAYYTRLLALLLVGAPSVAAAAAVCACACVLLRTKQF